MARKRPRRHGNASLDRPTVLSVDRPTRIESRSTRPTITESRSAMVARAYHKGREIRVFEAARGYYVEVDGATGVPGPFETIREALERGRAVADPSRYAAFKRPKTSRRRSAPRKR
jgi:hypothetical protein